MATCGEEMDYTCQKYGVSCIAGIRVLTIKVL